MAQLRRKFFLTVNLYDTTDSNRLRTGSGVSAELYPAGVECEVVTTIVAGVGTPSNVNCSGRGSLSVGQKVSIIRQSGGVWTDLNVSDLTLSAIEESASSEGVFVFTLTNTSATMTFSTAVGDRIVAKREAANRVTVYEDESDTTDTISQPITLPTSGGLEGYVDVRGLDVYLSGTGITDDWNRFNLGTFSGAIGPMRLNSEAKAADALVNIDASTTVLELNAATNPLTLLEHCAPDRMVILFPSASGVQITTLNSKADNTIYESTGRTLTLKQDAPLILVGHEASSGIAYWNIVGSPVQIDLSFDDLTDVDTSGAADGEPVVFDGANYVPSSYIGTAAAPLPTFYATDLGMYLVNAGGFYAWFSNTGMTGNRTIAFPDITGTVVMNAGAQNVGGQKTFDDGASVGFRMRNNADNTKIVTFDLSLLTSATTRAVKFPDKSGTIAMLSDAKTDINSLDDVSVSLASAEDILRFNGTDWVNDKSIGTTSAPMDQVIVSGERSDVGLTMVNDAGGTMQIADSELAASTGWDTSAYNTLLPGRNGNILLDNTNLKHVTVNFPFNGTTDGLFALLAANNALVLLRFNQDQPWSFETCWVVTKVWYQWVFESTAAVASPMTLSIYSNLGVPTTAAVPPTGTDELASASSPNIPVPSGVSHQVGVIDVWETAGNRNLGGVNFRHALYLARSGGTNGPTTRGLLTITVEYIKSQGRVKGSTEVDTTTSL